MSEAALAPNPPKLLDRVRHAIRVRHYSIRTEEAYVAWIKRYGDGSTSSRRRGGASIRGAES